MKKPKIFLNSKASEKVKKQAFFPYQDKVRRAYFSYSGLFWFLGLLVCIFSFFIIVNLTLNHQFQISNKIEDINFFCTPIFNIVLVIFAWTLLLFAPQKIYQSPKHSLVMLYFSFWFLVISVVLNAQLQLSYIDKYLNTGFYHWITPAVLKVLVVIMVFALFGIQIFFWIMRHKFAFMPSDYEIYQQRSINKKLKKEAKNQKKFPKTKI
ncbi:MAG: hypothetical protein REH79_01675 [Spiroplasma sp.]|nr:hypothetical protein [Spiroplasma sp.]